MCLPNFGSGGKTQTDSHTGIQANINNTLTPASHGFENQEITYYKAYLNIWKGDLSDDRYR